MEMKGRQGALAVHAAWDDAPAGKVSRHKQRVSLVLLCRAAPQPPAWLIMRLLVTNDDGIASPFLHALVRALQAAGHQTLVVAPLHEQSWTGAAKSRHRPVASAAGDHGLACPTWTVDGTPSDCVNIALAYLLPRRPGTTVADVEGVVSGINLGLNTTLGFILASGTVSAAWEGALHGLPALACSQDLDEVTFQQIKDGGPVTPALAATLAASSAHAAALAGELLPRTPQA